MSKSQKQTFYLLWFFSLFRSRFGQKRNSNISVQHPSSTGSKEKCQVIRWPSCFSCLRLTWLHCHENFTWVRCEEKHWHNDTWCVCCRLWWMKHLHLKLKGPANFVKDQVLTSNLSRNLCLGLRKLTKGIGDVWVAAHSACPIQGWGTHSREYHPLKWRWRRALRMLCVTYWLLEPCARLSRSRNPRMPWVLHWVKIRPNPVIQCSLWSFLVKGYVADKSWRLPSWDSYFRLTWTHLE